MYVIPKKGYKIPDPSLGDHLPDTGRKVEMSPYWARRLRDGDITEKLPSQNRTKNNSVKEDK
ncbi:DUF2635 domain-containing protein [Acinetobacter modestus]|uniref:DUF2635 domain-containing protein n=1 Tax=Acinetobacter modestus TaxID=1776740 RepID=UPI00301981F1